MNFFNVSTFFYCFYMCIMFYFQRAKILFFYDNENVCAHKIDICQKSNFFYE